MRRVLCALCVFILLMGLSVPAFAATSIDGARADAVLDTDGSCQITLSANLVLEDDVAVRFPVPGNARGITVNGSGGSTRKEGDYLTVDLSRVTGNHAGSYTIVLRYTVPNTVSYTEAGEPQLELPLLCGFSYAITNFAFSVTLPEQVQFEPKFISGYHQQSIGTDLIVDDYKGKNQISGHIPGMLKDRETFLVRVQLTQETFPRSAVEAWSVEVVNIIALVFMGLALLYWIFFLRCAPHLRRRSFQSPAGGTAGELRCALIGQGADLTMMVMSWAQMGYILIHVRGAGRVTLYKRMDMGNERGSFENKVFRTLFGKRATVDGNGLHYARLCRQVAASRTSLRELFRRSNGNIRVLRLLAAGAGLFGGVSLAIGLAGNALLAVLIILILAIGGGAGAWFIHSWVEGLHLRDRGALILALSICAGWIALGFMAGGGGMAIGVVAFQLLVGLAGFYGGRRTSYGRATTSQVLGLRSVLHKMTSEELERVCQNDPDYFFTMAPYALALGVDKAFAAQFGSQRMGPCPWLVTGLEGTAPASLWALEMRRAASALDERQKRLPFERLMGR